MTTITRDQPARWRLRHLIAFLAVLALTIFFASRVAGATNVDVTQSAACVNAADHRYNVTVSAHNTYSQTLHVTVKNPASDIGLTLQPGDSWSYTFHVTDGPWKVTFTTTDAHLVGDVTHTWTLTDVCGVTVTTTTPPTTTCSQANPPRNDCTTAPPPVSTLPDIPVPSTVAPEPSTTVPSTPASSAAPPSSSPPEGGAAHPTTIAQPITLPVTGSSDAINTAAIAAAFVTVGVALIIVARRRTAS